jgi:hypothetical protein
MAESKNIMTEDLGNGNFRQTETTGAPAIETRMVCTDATRPAATEFLPGTRIWNTDDNAFNYSDGTSWYNAVGVLT